MKIWGIILSIFKAGLIQVQLVVHQAEIDLILEDGEAVLAVAKGLRSEENKAAPNSRSVLAPPSTLLSTESSQQPRKGLMVFPFRTQGSFTASLRFQS